MAVSLFVWLLVSMLLGAVIPLLALILLFALPPDPRPSPRIAWLTGHRERRPWGAFRN
jgi:hypothetical protein